MPIKRTNWYKAQCLDPGNYPTNEWYRNNEDRNFPIVNIGSSSALYAFDYDKVGIKGFNWALQPQSMEYGFKVLKNFFSILRPKGIVTIPLCPFSGLSVPSREWAQSTVERYCGILDGSLIENYNRANFSHYHPLLSKPKESIKRLIKDIPSVRDAQKCITPEDFKSDADRWIHLWKSEFKINDLNEPLSQANVEGMVKRQNLVNEIIAFCLERNLQPVIISPPVHEALINYFTDDFCRNYLFNFISGLDLKGVPYIHWLNPKMDSPIAFDSSDFQNSFFLNSKGSEKFMKAYIEYLKLNNLFPTDGK